MRKRSLAPGLTCSEVRPPLEELSFGRLLENAIDNEGRVLAVGSFASEVVGPCGLRSLRREDILVAFERTRRPNAARDLNGSMHGRRGEGVEPLGVIFDRVQGSLFLGLLSMCQRTTLGPGCPFTGPQPSTFAESLPWVARIDGFTPLADVLPPPPLPEPLCSNGQDDDGDGQIDAADAHCKSDADNDESRP